MTICDFEWLFVTVSGIWLAKERATDTERIIKMFCNYVWLLVTICDSEGHRVTNCYLEYDWQNSHPVIWEKNKDIQLFVFAAVCDYLRLYAYYLRLCATIDTIYDNLLLYKTVWLFPTICDFTWNITGQTTSYCYCEKNYDVPSYHYKV